MKFVEMMQIVAGFLPVDMQAGANDGDWINMKMYEHAAVVLLKAAGTAGDDPTLTIEQATSPAPARRRSILRRSTRSRAQP